MVADGGVSIAKTILRVEGLDCAEEARALRGAVQPLAGVTDVAFDVTRARMVVKFDAAAVDEEQIGAAIGRAGFRAFPWGEAPDDRAAKRLRAGSTILSGLATAVGVGLVVSDASGVVPFAIGVAAGAWHVLPKAASAARRLRPDMNLLMVIAIAGAIAIGEWFEASTVAFLFSLSLALEAWSVGRARHAVESLLELAPTIARVVGGDGAHTERPADEVPADTSILIKPGERVPLDGVIATGNSQADESLLTGESMPVPKQPGDPVYAGSINGDGVLEVRTTKTAEQSTVAHIARLVESAAERRSRSERWVDAFAAVYTPVVIVLALLVVFVPPLLFGAGWAVWFYRALVLLVIACPCALVISTPVSIVSGLTAAARNGVLVKEGDFLETPCSVRTVAFDKTGTLTEGRPRVVALVALEDHTEEELLTRAAALEAASNHPLAAAVIQAARDRGVPFAVAQEARAVPGRGVEGRFDGRLFWLGSHRWLEERAQETPVLHERIEALSGPGRSVVVVGNSEHVCGLIAVADDVRPEAAAVIGELHAAGVERVVMLTGDNEPTARAIGARVGVDEVLAELLPAEKTDAIERLAKECGPVAMVG
ncbi:MAG: cation-translocating P-type ATPase, partial [Planctomycetota bacterium]|nr:cation-translocating P-type ATPase [Planctomycetota bacterium]